MLIQEPDTDKSDQQKESVPNTNEVTIIETGNMSQTQNAFKGFRNSKSKYHTYECCKLKQTTPKASKLPFITTMPIESIYQSQKNFFPKLNTQKSKK